MSVITIERKVLEKNDQVAVRNRSLFKERGIYALNLVSSPGAGKTSILEKTFQELQTEMHMAVIEGDVQTDLDAQRVSRYGVPVVQIVTLGGCHLDAGLVQDALAKLDLTGVEMLFIENVGNLVCPSNYDLGEGSCAEYHRRGRQTPEIPRHDPQFLDLAHQQDRPDPLRIMRPECSQGQCPQNQSGSQNL